MKQNNTKQKTISGLTYRFFERSLAKAITFCVSLYLARLILPEEYGVVALVMIFIAIANVFVTYGFGNSLIVNNESDSTDFSTCFYSSVILSLVLYVGVFFAAPLIARYYQNELLTPIIRVMAIRLPIAAVNSIQHAYVSKHMLFKKFFWSTLFGTILSGVVGIAMAYAGYGPWALVAQYLTNTVVDTIILFITLDWKLTLEFSFARLKKILNFGWKILVLGFFDVLFSRLIGLIIAKRYTSSDLAYYNKGTNFPSTGMEIVESTINPVLLPALARNNNDKPSMKAITKRTIRVSSFILYPIMFGLAAVAVPLISVFLTDRWLPSVMFLQIACAAYLFRPIQVINMIVMKACGESGVLLKLDLLKKSIELAILIAGMFFGIRGIALSFVVSSIVSAAINIHPSRKLIGYGYWEQIKDVAQPLFISAIMFVCVYLIGSVDMNIYLSLLVQVVSGAIIYVGLSWVFKSDSLQYLLDYLKSFRKKREQQE